MITITTILVILAAIGAYRFFYKEEDLDEMNKLFAFPFAMATVFIPAFGVIGIIYLALKYLP